MIKLNNKQVQALAKEIYSIRFEEWNTKRLNELEKLDADTMANDIAEAIKKLPHGYNEAIRSFNQINGLKGWVISRWNDNYKEKNRIPNKAERIEDEIHIATLDASSMSELKAIFGI